MFPPFLAVSLISALAAKGMTITETINMNTRIQMKIDTLPVFLTAKSANLRPPTVPITDQIEIQKP